MHTPHWGISPQGGAAAARKVGRAPQRLRGWGVEVGLPTLLYNRKDLVTLMGVSSFLLHKRSAMDAHAAIRNFTVLRCRSSAQAERAPQRLRG